MKDKNHTQGWVPGEGPNANSGGVWGLEQGRDRAGGWSPPTFFYDLSTVRLSGWFEECSESKTSFPPIQRAKLSKFLQKKS